MPYIITTRVDVHGDELSVDVVSRRDVATLEEARAHVFRDVTNVPGYTAIVGFPTDAAIAHEISDAGGTIGPLPDGTIIVVERTGERP